MGRPKSDKYKKRGIMGIMDMVKRKYISVASVFILGLVTLFFGASSSVSATSSSASATVHVPDACTLISTLNTPHTATLSPGTSTGYGNSGGVNGIGQTTLKVTCNDSLGFAIYAIGYTEDTFGNTNLVSNTKYNGVSTYTIATGTNTSGANSNWAMQINAVSGSFAPTVENSFDSSNYHNVPTTYTMVAKRTSATMNPADSSTQNTGSSITTTYAAYISTEQAPDTYTGKVKYTMVHPSGADPGQQEIECEAGKICYSSNTSTSIGQMGKQSASNNTSITLWAPNFKRQGYGFAGWNTEYNHSGTYYGPNQDITTPADIETNGLSLYAVWIESEGTLQNWNDCSGMNIGDITALTDNRDNDTYAVAKLADGKCWMTENLRLDNTPELSSTNTHNPSLPIVNIYDATNPTTSNHLSTPTDPTQTPWSGTSYNQSMLATNNTTLFINNNPSNYDIGSDVYIYGNNYNWYSAAAGYRFQISVTSNNSPATGDICPAGWHLMKRLDSSVLNQSINSGAYGSNASNGFRSYPVNFVYSGYVTGSYFYNRSSIGFYWYPSFSDSNYRAEGFWLDASDAHTYGNLFMNYGASVRCVSDV